MSTVAYIPFEHKNKQTTPTQTIIHTPSCRVGRVKYTLTAVRCVHGRSEILGGKTIIPHSIFHIQKTFPTCSRSSLSAESGRVSKDYHKFDSKLHAIKIKVQLLSTNAFSANTFNLNVLPSFTAIYSQSIVNTNNFFTYI